MKVKQKVKMAEMISGADEERDSFKKHIHRTERSQDHDTFGQLQQAILSERKALGGVLSNSDIKD